MCETDEFICDNGQCITKYWTCDGVPDCLDGTDEEETTCTTCPFKFLCANGKCTDLESVCDGTNDCQDRSDEDQICVGKQ